MVLELDTNGDTLSKEIALRALGKMGPKAGCQTAKIANLLDDHHQSIRVAAAQVPG